MLSGSGWRRGAVSTSGQSENVGGGGDRGGAGTSRCTHIYTYLHISTHPSTPRVSLNTSTTVFGVFSVFPINVDLYIVQVSSVSRVSSVQSVQSVQCPVWHCAGSVSGHQEECCKMLCGSWQRRNTNHWSGHSDQDQCRRVSYGVWNGNIMASMLMISYIQLGRARLNLPRLEIKVR